MVREHGSWGARKIRERLLRRFSGIPIPAKSTIHAVLDRHGLVERRGRVRRRAQGTELSFGKNPNELRCTDYKGEFLPNHLRPNFRMSCHRGTRQECQCSLQRTR